MAEQLQEALSLSQVALTDLQLQLKNTTSEKESEKAMELSLLLLHNSWLTWLQEATRSIPAGGGRG